MKDRPDCGVLLLHNSDRDEFSGGKEAIGDDLSGMTMSISTLLVVQFLKPNIFTHSHFC